MKHAARLARGGAVYTARETLHRERPFGLVLVALAIIGAVIAGVACNSKPSHAGSTAPGDTTANHFLFMPSILQPFPRLTSTCDSEANPCN